jgi:catalase
LQSFELSFAAAAAADDDPAAAAIIPPIHYSFNSYTHLSILFNSYIFLIMSHDTHQSQEVKLGEENAKTKQLTDCSTAPSLATANSYHKCPFRVLQTEHGVSFSQRSNDNTLKGGSRGPSLLSNDFLFRSKITHFDHERIPERVVHARGSAAHGYFQSYNKLSNLTKAEFLTDPSVKTPVFVRFSTVLGSRGSADTPRDVRGFATKFYTNQGNFDLVGNNIPVFFIQDAMKFPDLVHAAKPEPHNEVRRIPINRANQLY